MAKRYRIVALETKKAELVGCDIPAHTVDELDMMIFVTLPNDAERIRKTTETIQALQNTPQFKGRILFVMSDDVKFCHLEETNE